MYHEYFLKYDNKHNFQKNLPNSLSDPILWSDNNVKEIEYKDYTGLLDVVCNPCKSDFKYNSDKFPKSISYDWGREATLSYE